MEWRRRAAEALSWLPPLEGYELTVNSFLTTLLAHNPELFVRRAVKYEHDELQRRRWASDYLQYIRRSYGKGNKHRILTWRYAHALIQIGNDTTIKEIQTDLNEKTLASYERHWLVWILKQLREQWEKQSKSGQMLGLVMMMSLCVNKDTFPLQGRGFLMERFIYIQTIQQIIPTSLAGEERFFQAQNFPGNQDKREKLHFNLVEAK